MHANFKNEPSPKAWMFRLIFGPALLLDGAVQTLSLGTLSLGAALWVARRLSLERHTAQWTKVLDAK